MKSTNNKVMILSSHTPSIMWFRMDMIKSFMAKGFEAVVVGNEPKSNWEELFKNEGIRYIEAKISRNGTNPFSDLSTLRSLNNIIKEEKPDKIFCYQAKTVIYGSIAAHLNRIDECYSLIAGVGSVFLSNGFKSKIIRSILKFEYKISLKHNKKVFFQNNDDVSMFVEYGIVDKNKLTMIPGSGVNLKRFKKQSYLDNPSFLYVGRLIKDKGVYEYLEACKKVKENFPNVKCMLVGPFDSNKTSLTKEELDKYIENSIVEYYGEQRDVVPYLEKCNIFVLPSYREGTPKAVLEAMACGKAIITTDAPGCRETVINEINGYLVPIKNTNAIVEKMIYLIKNNNKIREFSDNSYKLAKEKFDVEIVNKIICDTMGI